MHTQSVGHGRLASFEGSARVNGLCTTKTQIPLIRRRLTSGSRSRKVAPTLAISAAEKERVTALFYETEKEKSRKYRRTVFTHEDWFRHRSTNRYTRHMNGLLASRIVRGLAVPLGTVVAIASFVTIYELLRESGSLPEYCPRLVVETSQPFNLTSFALSLLLVFRTNASYSRWDEARKIWGGILNRTRDIVRQSLTWIEPDQQELREMFARWVIALPVSLKCQLMYGSDLEADLKDVLQPQELEALLQAEHRPNYSARVLSEIMHKAKLSDIEVFLMDHNLTFFADAIGGCERLLSSPIPLSWTRHTSRFLVIWLVFMPFLLFSTCRYATVPVAFIVALLLLGIEEIGVQIEEPFSILALDAICAKSARNIREMQAQENVSDSLVELQLPPGRGGQPAIGGNSNSNSNSPESEAWNRRRWIQN